MPSEADEKTDYRRYRSYYLKREESAKGKHVRVERNQARNREIKTGTLTGPHDPREVDHKKPLSKGGANTAANTRVISRTANRRKYNH